MLRSRDDNDEAHAPILRKLPPSASDSDSGDAYGALAADSAVAGHGSSKTYVMYRERWLVVVLFCLLTMANAMLWITFAPINSRSASYYGASSTAIDWLSMLFMVVYLPGTLLASFCYRRYGMRVGLGVSCVLNMAGAWLRFGSTAVGSHRFEWVIAGQTLIGLSQPFLTNAPAALANAWFSVEQRDVATTISAMANPVGIGIGQVLPPILVHGGMGRVLFVEAAIISAVCVLVLLFVKERPPTPPSRSVDVRQGARGEDESGLKAAREVWDEIRKCMRDRNFVILCFSFGVGLALFNALNTLIEQIIKPYGYDSDDASVFGVLIILPGLLGAAISAPLLDRTHKYNEALRIGFGCAGLGGVLLVCALREDFKVVLSIAFAFLGLFMIPLLPISFQCAAECTYPLDEEISSGLLMLSGNGVGIALILGMGSLIDAHPHDQHLFKPSNILFVLVLVVVVTVVQFYRGPYKRLDEEQSKSRVVNNDYNS